MKRIFTSIALTAALTTAAAADEKFLEGFPDVPLLEGLTEIADERVVFDTPAGTVAQTALVSDKGADEALKRYGNTLTAFGWQCKRVARALTCAREENKLLFKGEQTADSAERIILRLEPNKYPDMP